MKKIFLFISPIIAFFLGGFILSFSCNAEAMPSLSNDTIHMILDGNESLTYSTYSSFNVLPVNVNPTEYSNLFASYQDDPLITGAMLNTLDSNEYNVQKLTQDQIETISSQVPYLYDVNGNAVQWDDIYYVTYLNGMFHGSLYVDNNGNILTFDIDKTKTAFKLGLGGYLLGVTDIANIYSDIQSQLYAQQYNLDITGADISNIDMTLYVLIGCAKFTGNTLYKSITQVYIPNTYDYDYITPYNPHENTLWNVFLTTEEPTIYYSIYGNVPYMYGVNYQNRNNNYNGKNYSYRFELNSRIPDSQTPHITQSEFFNLSNNGFNNGDEKVYILGYNGWVYNSNNANLANQNEILSFKKINIPSTKQIQIDEDYNYNDIKELEENLNNTDISENTDFDPSEEITPNNYPYEIDVPSSTPIIEPSEIPFPSNNPNPEPNPMPDPATAPSIGSDIGEVDPTELRSTIPVINNLLNRFPFSIPWDIYGLLSGLSVQRETPYINTTIHIPGINYDWVLDYDLSDFDGIASLFRTLFLIAFILGLAYFSYDHFFGS